RVLDEWILNYFCSANTHSDPPGGTAPRRSSPEKSEYTPPIPLVTATYCTPSCCHVTGWPSMPEPVLNCHSFLPVFASNASNSPVSCPANTTPPAVESTPEKRGMSLAASHFALPVIGSIAFRWPRGPVPHSHRSERSIPTYHSPALYSAGTAL